MTSDPRCVYPETLVVEAAKLMRDERVNVLPVCDGRRLIGILTGRDIVRRHVAEGWVNRTVGAILTPLPYLIAPDSDVLDAVAMMLDHGVRRLPVCDNGELVGVISRSDIDGIVEQGKPHRRGGPAGSPIDLARG